MLKWQLEEPLTQPGLSVGGISGQKTEWRVRISTSGISLKKKLVYLRRLQFPHF